MAGKQVNFEVDVNASKAQQGLREFASAVKKANKDAADSFDDTSTAGERAATTITDMARKMDAELRDSAAAADALAAALGPELTAQMDIPQIVDDLKRMGLSMDDVRGDADKLAASLKEVDSIRLQQVNEGLGQASTHLRSTATASQELSTSVGRMRGEADQSRSVLANLAGNSAQSLGNLGGVVGDLGVGIGQLTEYAVDGNIAMGNLAKVAGPMAGLAAAGVAVQTVFANIAKSKAFDAEQIQNYADAIADVGTGVEAVNTALTEANELTALVPADNPLSNLFRGTDTVDVISILDSVGVKLSDINDIIESGDPERARRFIAAFFDAGQLTNEDALNAIKGLQDQQDAYADAVENSAAKTRFFASTVESVNDQIRRQQLAADPLAALSESTIKFGQVTADTQLVWRQLVNDLRDGVADSAATALAVDAFSEAMGISKDAVVELAIAQGDASKSAGNLQGAQRGVAGAIGDTADNAQAAADALESMMDKQQAIIDAASALADAQQAWDDALAALPGIMAESTSAMDDNAEGTKDWVDARNSARDTLQGDVDLFVEATKQQALQNGQTLTAVEIEHARAEGLARLAGTVDDRVIPAVADYYAQVLKIPDEKKTEFELLLLEGDQAKIEEFIAANSGTKQLAIKVTAEQAQLDKVKGQIDGVGANPQAAVVPVYANTSPADQTMSAWRKGQANTSVTVPVKVLATTVSAASFVKIGGRSVEESTGLAAAPTASAVHTPSAVTMTPVAAAPNINFTINTGVLGNHFDVERSVTRALRRASRVNGRRAVTNS